jgi:hypothetical protein
VIPLHHHELVLRAHVAVERHAWCHARRCGLSYDAVYM